MWFKEQEICSRLSAKTSIVFHVVWASEELFLESKKVKHESQWRNKGFGDARASTLLQSRDAYVEWNQLKKETYIKPLKLEAQSYVNFLTFSMELQKLMFAILGSCLSLVQCFLIIPHSCFVMSCIFYPIIFLEVYKLCCCCCLWFN